MTSPDSHAIVGAAAVPSAPLLLPVASPEQPETVRDEVHQLRAAVEHALRELPSADVTVLVASGERGVYDRAAASLAPVGVVDGEVELPVAERVVEHLSRIAQFPVFRGDDLSLDLSVLTMLLHRQDRDGRVVPLAVSGTSQFDILVSVGASIGEALRDADLSARLVVAADLSAGLEEQSPRYRIEGARAWDEAIVAATKSGDLARLEELGPEESERVHARGWAPLAVLHGACASNRLRPELVAYLAPRGVGQLVALCRAAGDPAEGERYRVGRAASEGRG